MATGGLKLHFSDLRRMGMMPAAAGQQVDQQCAGGQK
jgi:hypothetical protein